MKRQSLTRFSVLPPAPAPKAALVAQALPPREQAYFESRLDQDFSQVRVHTEEGAAASAAALGAKAFATGHDIFFSAGGYNPESAKGRELLAHELAHVAQQQRGGSGGPAQAEPRARAAAQTVAQGGEVSPESLGGAQQGMYCDPEDDKKKPEDPTSPSVLPPMPNLTLSTTSPIDWLKMRQSFDFRGQSLSLRDGDDISKEWQRSSRLLDTFGIDDRFKLGFITKDWILNKGISLQLEDWQSRENPNALDRSNRDWKNAYPDAWQTPIVPIFDLDWFRSKKKK